MSRLMLVGLFCLAMLAAACSQSGEGTAVATPAPSATAAPPLNLVTPTPTHPPPSPTPTHLPPTATATVAAMATATAVPQGDAIEIDPANAADDGCALVDLNTAVWSPLTALFNSGSDPFYQFHTNEPDFYFNIELYTVFGPSWTGQTGAFPPDCNGNGICVYLVPDNANQYWATAGEVTINALAQADGAIVGDVDIRLTDLTMEPVPGTNGEGCFYIDEAAIQIESDEPEPETAVGYPILPDAANLTETPELVAFETAALFDEVVTFYKTEMAAAGWTLADDFQRPPRATLTFEKGAAAVQINLNPVAATGGVLVMIAVLP